MGATQTGNDMRHPSIVVSMLSDDVSRSIRGKIWYLRPTYACFNVQLNS